MFQAAAVTYRRTVVSPWGAPRGVEEVLKKLWSSTSHGEKNPQKKSMGFSIYVFVYGAYTWVFPKTGIPQNGWWK